MKIYLGVDVGSVSVNVVAMDESEEVLAKIYIRSQGDPISAIKKSFSEIKEKLDGEVSVLGVGTTGSGRSLAAALVGADLVKNEITSHAEAAKKDVKNVRTVVEIGGQDSKIILLENGTVTDFAMNTVCAAGTGSFLDQQSGRLGIDVKEFGDLALKSEKGVKIAGRCTVFAESDMIHKQQTGASKEDIIRGLCESLVRNYINNVAKGKELKSPIVFQGGVAANKGMKREFEKELGQKIIIPRHFDVMGAYGVALLVKKSKPAKTKFKGFQITNVDFKTTSFECKDCPNKCEIIEFKEDGYVIARWGSRCGKWAEADKY